MPGGVAGEQLTLPPMPITSETVAQAAKSVAECVVAVAASLYRGWRHISVLGGGIDCSQQ
jgi:hypothetical protein